MEAQKQGELSAILAGIKFAEFGNLNGDYQAKRFMKGETFYGAYAIPSSQWQPWAEFSGVGGAPWESDMAQDRVAATVLAEYYNRFGSWDLAIVAWFAGPESATNMMKNGWEGPDSIKNPEIKDYLSKTQFGTAEAQKPVNAAFLRTIATDNFALTRPGTQWIMPVAGESEWSGGSFMDKHTKHEGSHHAIDVYAREGTPIVSPKAGRVVSVGSGGRGGNWARVQGDDGVMYYFAHMASSARVSKGQLIKAGEHIGFVGDTGSAKGTKPHLHFSMKKNGKPLNPKTYLTEASVMGYSERNISPEDAEMMMMNGQKAGLKSNMTGWIQQLSDGFAGGQRELPPRWEEGGEVEALERPEQPEPTEMDDKLEMKEARTAGRNEMV
jgi:murein DD-endopeptidase MepM/ murein hydrolase activator NlpD